MTAIFPPAFDVRLQHLRPTLPGFTPQGFTQRLLLAVQLPQREQTYNAVGIRTTVAHTPQTLFWFSMYCLITAGGAPSTVATKYELVHKVDLWERNQGYS